VASKHKSAPWFLKQGFFEGIKSFKEFEARTLNLADTVEMGDALEILVEALLHLDKVLYAKDVWVVGSIPSNIRKALNLPNDSKGIDGVYADQAGNYIPYQVKYRTDMDTLPYGEISPFLGITEKSLQDRMIFTNARKLSVDVANRTGVRSFRADKFHELTEADFKRIYAWLTDKKVEPFKRWDPLPHQQEAIEKITGGLKEADRTSAVMACGTGKTLVALWAAEAQDPKTVLVLVPSLALLSQTLPDWCKQTSWGKRFRYLCVCSDASVDRPAKDADEYALNQTDLEFTVTTDAKEVKKFQGLNKDGVNVIFSTYQSAEVVAEGLKGQTVDLGVFDEAHKTTGDKKGLFAFGLSDKNIRIKKRLFLTATPRHYKLNKRDKDGDFHVVSMNDESVYGKVSYRLPFSAAVAAGIIVPYKVIISVSLNKEVDAELLRRGSTRVRRDELNAKWVANQIALKRAIEKTGASKIITFHSRVNLAEEFAGDSARGFQEHVKGFDVFHVNGGQNAADRKALLEDFKASPRGLITNARCLTEGVDVPAVDMVAFVNPRKSKIDIAQAAGRAMRQSKATNKKLGYIVVPLFIEQKKGETEAEAFNRAGFDEVAEVLAAMLESDDDLVDTIKEMQEARGHGDKFNPRNLHEKIEIIGPSINLDKLTQSIDVEILDRLGVSWDRWFGELKKFRESEGHCRVRSDHKVDKLRLGAWVSQQRGKKHELSAERIARLDSIDFNWDPLSEQWEQYFKALKNFSQRMGHCRITAREDVDGLKLGRWANRQIQQKEQLTKEQISRLDSLGFIWDPNNSRWDECFTALHDYHKRNGHYRVERAYSVGRLKLGDWITTQRKNKDKLSPEQIERLNSIGFTWSPLNEKWMSCYKALKAFHQRTGHCKVGRNGSVHGIKLGAWIHNLRKKKSGLSAEQINSLNEINFDWDPLSEKWGRGFTALQKFYQKNGHCNAGKHDIIDGLKLDRWIIKQRDKKAELTPEQLNNLNSLNFHWSPFIDRWETSFSALQNFAHQEGHCLVPRDKKIGRLNLGLWVRVQRAKRDVLTQSQISRLNSLGFSWDPLVEQWEESFSELKRFYEKNGHCRVSKDFKAGSIKLGIWVSNQRKKRDSLSPNQIERLNSLQFSWDALSDKWEMAFSALQEFHQRKGHCRVPHDFSVNGLKLGSWVSNQRQNADKISPERVSRLNALEFSWDARAELWEKAYDALLEFYQRERHCRVPFNFVVDGLKLGVWVVSQRQKKEEISHERVERLNSLGFTWDPHTEKWEAAFSILLKFYQREGHCLVTQGIILDGLKLGVWVRTQRINKESLSQERIKRLDSIGFVWRV